MNEDAYHSARFTEDPRRDVLWNSLWRYHFRYRVKPTDCVLDLGCGYGSFINQVVARRRIALDRWPGFQAHLAPGVEPIVGDITELSALADGSVDFAFSSNVFEHLTQDQVASVLAQLRRILAPGGVLCLLQPNYRYAYREYFDDYTHVSVWSDVSLVDFLTAHGYAPGLVVPRFTPLSIKSRMPVHPLLIRAYLALPIRPLGKQMLIEARPA
jgi:SAM-dependent methyltransferase